MKIQALSVILMCSVLTARATHQARADSDGARCFDFSVSAVRAPRAPSMISAALPPRISGTSGKLPSGPVWAAARGEVTRPIENLMLELAWHESTKAGRVSDMQITPLHVPGFLMRQKVRFTIKPFLFVTVGWTEDWAFSLTQGTKEAPREITALYEKTEGTSHIRHLCGAIVLNKVRADATDVFIYEEADATGRTQEDTLKGVTATIGKLRSALKGRKPR
jgi:hypothetical protein